MRILSIFYALLLSLNIMIAPQLTFGLTKTSPPTQLLQINITTPHQLDELWLAYFTYKDTRYIDKIIETYANIVIDPKIDFMDIVMFAQCQSPECKNQFSAQFKAIPQKYPTIESRMKLILASAAFWSLTSNAHQHPLVDQYIQKYIRNTPHTLITVPLKITIEKLKQNK